jgi:DNA/RNA-binding domain of Phe-tRNA-synthetase-like protein
MGREKLRGAIRLDVKQGGVTKMDANTRHLVLIVQGNPAIPGATVRQQTEALCRDIADRCGGEYEILGEVTGVPQHAG